MKLFRTSDVQYRLLLNVRIKVLICRVSSLFVVGRNFRTSYITVIVCNSLLWMFFVCFFRCRFYHIEWWIKIYILSHGHRRFQTFIWDQRGFHIRNTISSQYNTDRLLRWFDLTAFYSQSWCTTVMSTVESQSNRSRNRCKMCCDHERSAL